MLIVGGELHVAMDQTDFLAVFPLKGDGRARLIGTVRENARQSRDDLSWNDVSRRVIEWIRIDVERVNWFSTHRSSTPQKTGSAQPVVAYPLHLNRGTTGHRCAGSTAPLCRRGSTGGQVKRVMSRPQDTIGATVGL